MAKDARWVRLNVGWDESSWLEDLPWAVRAVWPVILCHVKVFGSSGRCPVPSWARFAGGHDIPADLVKALVEAATADGALLIEDGYMTVSNWNAYQGAESTERVAKLREKQKAAIVTDGNACNVTPVTRPRRNVTPDDETLPCHATETETETGTGTKTETPSGRGVGETKLRPILMEVPAFAKSPPAAGKLDEILEDFSELGEAAILRHAKAARDWALEPKTRYARSPDKPADGVKFLRNWLEKELRSARNGSSQEPPGPTSKGWNPSEEELAEIHR